MKGLIEPVHIHDESCSGLALIENLGNCARFVLFRHSTIYETGQVVPIVCAKILLPYDAIMPGIEMAGRFVATHTIQSVSNVVRLKLR